MKSALFASLLVLGLTAAALAQPAAGLVSPDQMQARYQIGVMESVLERAVEHGATMLGRQLETMVPNLLLVAPPRARGFRLDGYGVFFDVEVPALRRSMAWTFRTLMDQDLNLDTAFQSLRAHVQSVGDARARADLEQALKRLELQVGLPTAPAGAAARPATAARAASPIEPTSAERSSAPPPPAPKQSDDPGQTYTDEVKGALIDVMLDYSGPLAIGSEEWLTIAARDNDDRLTPATVYDTMTLVLRIRGSDLAAFRADRLTKEEARKRVEVREF